MPYNTVYATHWGCFSSMPTRNRRLWEGHFINVQIVWVTDWLVDWVIDWLIDWQCACAELWGQIYLPPILNKEHITLYPLLIHTSVYRRVCHCHYRLILVLSVRVFSITLMVTNSSVAKVTLCIWRNITCLVEFSLKIVRLPFVDSSQSIVRYIFYFDKL